LPEQAAGGRTIGDWRRLDFTLIGLCAFFAWVAYPTMAVLAGGLWQQDDHAFAPLIIILSVAMAAWIYWQPSPVRHPAASGYLVMLAGGLLLCAGVLLGNVFLRSTALLVILAGLTLALSGIPGLRRYFLPLLALVFAIPLPGAWVTAITFPLKMAISHSATWLLRLAGFPISNQGVTIDLGNYRLLVADACSGLQSMFSLLAVVTLYVFLMRIDQPRRIAFLFAAIIPVVIALNILRVIALALITYWLGNAAGEGFLHSMAGFAMFIAAFACLMFVDTLVERFA
jgi:exosortase